MEEVDYVAELFSTEDFESEERPDKRTRLGKEKVTEEDLWRSPWGQLLLDPDTANPTSRSGKKWLARFRVPFPVFTGVLVPECEKENVFDLSGKRKCSIPIEFKILVGLRLFGRSHD